MTCLAYVGGATGIGAATVNILAKSGASVVIGDINDEAAEKLASEYAAVSFVRCDVTKYGDIYNLFKTAYDKHGHIDHAVSCAGIYEIGNCEFDRRTPPCPGMHEFSQLWTICKDRMTWR